MKVRIKHSCLPVLLVTLGWLLAGSGLLAQQLDILVLGSSKSYSPAVDPFDPFDPSNPWDYWLEADAVPEKAFNPSTIASELQSILTNDSDITESVNVVFEDIFRSKQVDTSVGVYSGGAYNYSDTFSFTYYCYSLAQYYMWPEGKDDRHAYLRGDPLTGAAAWDYVVITADPYLMANMPGIYAEGVKLVADEISKGTGTPILLAQWPENSSNFTATQFNEVVHRVGQSAGIQVVTAGKAWDTYSSQDTSANHPTPHGAYLAAASVYSKLYDKSAKTTSSYVYVDAPTTESLSDHALSVVQTAAGEAQYSGNYTASNPFQMRTLSNRTVDWSKYGADIESGFADGILAACEAAKVTSNLRTDASVGDPVDFSYARGGYLYELDWQYDDGSQLDYDNHTFGFPVGDQGGTGATTMLYGIDKRYDTTAEAFYDGTDLGIAHTMLMENQVPLDVRGVPVRLLWAKMNHANLEFSLHNGNDPDQWLPSDELNRAVGAYLYTAASGRCPVEAEPADNTSTEWKHWWCRKLGYETAWQMAHLTTRAPGFRVTPSSAEALTIAEGETETMTVEFINPPTSDVTVTVSLSNSTAAIVGPRTLTFTPSNYDTPQEVVVAAIPGALASDAFEVIFSTSSTDDVYDGLGDSWAYTTTRTSTLAVSQTDNGTGQITVMKNTPRVIDLNAAGANITNSILIGPLHGSATWPSDGFLEYTPATDYLGKDFIAYAATVGSAQTIGYLEITVEEPGGKVNVSAPDALAAETGPDTGTFVIDRIGGDTTNPLVVLFSMSGSATQGAGNDYTLSDVGSVTIPAGLESVTITLTPVDDSVVGELREMAVLTLVEDAAYEIGAAATAIGIVDNDNSAPTANAGADISLLMPEVPSPADVITTVWFDAADASTVVRDGNNKVSQWNDKSVNGNHAYQEGTSAQPTYDEVNGKLNFDGGDLFKVTNDPFHGLQNFAVIALQRWSGSMKWKNAAASYHGESGNGWQMRQRGSSIDKLTFTRRGSGGWDDPDPVATVNDADHIAVGLRRDSRDVSIRHNGSVIYSATDDTGSITYNGTNRSAIGGRYHGDGWSSANGQLKGHLKEVIVIENATDDEVAMMEAYLADKWGLVDALPEDHPYREMLTVGPEVTVNLAGEAGDVDSGTLTTTWSVVSTNPAGLESAVIFADPSALDTAVTFTSQGEYTLRLTVSDGNTEVTSDVVFTVVPQDGSTYAVTYDSNTANSGEVPVDDLAYSFEDTVTVLDNTGGLAKVGYTFDGWNTAADGSGTPYAAGSTFTILADTTLYAQWAAGTTYALGVTNGSGDGNYPEGAIVPITAEAPGANYYFTNWTSSAGGTFADAGSAGTDFTMPAGPVEVTANFELNSSPAVEAGPDQTVYMGDVAVVTPGITYDPITGDEDSGISSDKVYTHAVDFGSDSPRALINGVQFQAGGTTFGSIAGTSATIGTGTTSIYRVHGGDNAAEPYLNGASPCGMEGLVEDMNYGDSTAEITLTGLTPGVHYKFRLYHRSWGGTRPQDIGFVTDGVGTDLSGAGYTGSFYQDQASQPDPGFATDTQVYALTFDYVLSSGVTSLKVFINQTGTGAYHLYGLTNEQLSSVGPTVALNGASVTDSEQTPTHVWIDTGSGTGTGSVIFSNAYAINPTVTFTDTGTYVLRLVADDGFGTVYDEVVITVSEPLPPTYAAWAEGNFANEFSDIDPAANGDGDSLSNLMEFAFGTDPTIADGAALATGDSVHGAPVIKKGTGDVMEFHFMRRKDHGTSGSVSYRVQFSSDLTSFTYSVSIPEKVADSGLDPTKFEVMKVPYPEGKPFGRVEVEFVP